MIRHHIAHAYVYRSLRQALLVVVVHDFYTFKCNKRYLQPKYTRAYPYVFVQHGCVHLWLQQNIRLTAISRWHWRPHASPCERIMLFLTRGSMYAGVLWREHWRLLCLVLYISTCALARGWPPVCIHMTVLCGRVWHSALASWWMSNSCFVLEGSQRIVDI